MLYPAVNEAAEVAVVSGADERAEDSVQVDVGLYELAEVALVEKPMDVEAELCPSSHQ